MFGIFNKNKLSQQTLRLSIVKYKYWNNKSLHSCNICGSPLTTLETINKALDKFNKAHSIDESQTGLSAKLKNYAWGLKFYMSNGVPSKSFHLGGGLGDQLLGSAILLEWTKRDSKNLWFISNSQELYLHNPYVKKYGRYLQQKQFKKLNPIQSVDDKEPKIQEAKLAEKLRKKGWGVWQN